MDEGDAEGHARMFDPTALALSLIPLARMPMPGAEIPAFDRVSGRLLVTSSHDVHAVQIDEAGGLRGVGFMRVGQSGDDVTHVAIDPGSRGFAAACLVPERFATQFGHVVFFDPITLKEVARVAVGQNPDSCAFTPRGEFLIVANEGQPEVLASGQIVDPPGSITVIDLRSVRSMADLERVGEQQATTLLVSGAPLDVAMASGSPPRIAPRNRESPALDMEPEYVVAQSDHVAYVSLQENNALAEVALDPPRIVRITGLGAVERTLDGSDQDGPLGSSWSVLAQPMPDQIASFTSGGKRLLVTAEEGDSRGSQRGPEPVDPADTARVADLATWWGTDEDMITAPMLEARNLGRLNVLIDGADGDGNGKLDTLVTPGTRSIGVYDCATMERIGDTGSTLEVATLSLFGDDSRSADRGPEPEGVVLMGIGERTIALVSLERPGAVAALDLSSPLRPELLSIYPSAWDGDLGPEGMCLIDLPNGLCVLAVCFEASGTLVLYEVRATSR